MASSRMTVRLPDDLKTQLDDHPEINWSEVARRSMREYLARLELADALASQSDLTEADAGQFADMIKREVASHYDDNGEGADDASHGRDAPR